MRTDPRQALFLLALAAGCSGGDFSLGSGRLPNGAEPKAFSEPTPIAGLMADDADDDDPSLNAERTLLFFNSERAGGLGEEDIWFSRRASVDDGWGAPALAIGLNTGQRETGIALAPDGLAIWFSSDRPGGAGGLDVYRAERGGPAEDWSSPERVAELSSAGDDLVSSLADGGRRVYLARRSDDEDDYDLYRAERADGAGTFAAPQPLTLLNSEAEESDACETSGGQELLFTRARDIWSARRGGAGDFVDAHPIAALNSADDDRDVWSTPEGEYVVFSSDRSGGYLLYESHR